jgi:cobalt transporter subunit CbtB
MRRAGFHHATGPPLGREGGSKALTREPGNRPGKLETHCAVGCDGEEIEMNTKTTLTTTATTALVQVAFVALLGLTVMLVAGHAQSATLHDAAHDVRHATGFPCH